MLRKALIGGLLALLALLGLEGALRLVYSEEALLFEWERPSGLIAFSPVGGLLTRPGAAEDRRDGPYVWTVRINARGFREDAEVPADAPADTRRVLALGDSWVFGYSVDQGATISDRLEARLPAALGVPKVDVVNAGVFGSSAFDMLARYRQLIDLYEFDAVFLGTPHNTSRFRETRALRSTWYAAMREGPSSSLRTYLLVRRWLAPMRSGLYADPSLTDEAAEIADIVLLVRDARDRGLAVWFAELPNKLSQGLSGFSGVPRWTAALAPLGVVTAGHALGERACWGFQDHAHPSEAGADAIAARLAEAVAAGRSIPVGAEPTCASLPGVGPNKEGWAWAD